MHEATGGDGREWVGEKQIQIGNKGDLSSACHSRALLAGIGFLKHECLIKAFGQRVTWVNYFIGISNL